MKSFYQISIIACFLGLLPLHSDDTPLVADRVKVVEGAICHSVDKRQPINIIGSNNPASTKLGKLYCWTKVFNAYEPTKVIHVWYWQNTKMAEVPLDVGRSPGWRTWSSKRIQSHQKGEWRVEVLDENRNRISTIFFYLE